MPNKPSWKNLDAKIRTEWIQSTINFYPEGTFKTQASAEEAASVEYEQSDDLHPEVYPQPDNEENQ
jgi:hypothetical protein